MSDPRANELAEAARNRGLKLVRSRIRTSTKRRFGKMGLTNKAGEPIFGMDSNGPVATPEEVEEFLRNLNAKDWGASLDVAVLPRKRRTKGPIQKAANDAEPEQRHLPDARSKLPGKPKIRDAKPSDAERLAELIRYLGHPIDAKQVKRNLAALKKSGETPLVATLDKKLVGLCGIARRVVIARAAPLGRISTLVVAQEAQGRGIGRLLVETAEKWMRKQGCELVEVTSNDRRAEAHAFYRHMGYERTSTRFAKTLS